MIPAIPPIQYHRLHPLITGQEVEDMIELALTKGWQGICIPPWWVKKARRDIGTSELALATVIGYPYGYQRSEAKATEVELALKDGARDIEVTVNLSAIKMNNAAWVKIELMRLGRAIHEKEAFMTAIIDMSQLSEKETEMAIRLSTAAGCDYIKNTVSENTSAEIASEQVQRISSLIKSDVGIKVYGALSEDNCRQYLNNNQEIIYCLANK